MVRDPTGTSLILGVDGGNTKTVALLSREDGTILGRGRSGQSDIYGAGSVHTGVSELMLAVDSALAQANARLSDITIGCLSTAGADWPEDIDAIQSELGERGFKCRITVVNDAIGALRAGSERGPALSVVCGTGAATGARDAHGKTWHTGWWQEPQGALQLAHQTLRAVYRSDLGIDPPTTLTETVLAHFGRTSVEELLRSLTSRSSRQADLAPLTRLLLREADTGDTTSINIVRRHGESLGDYAIAAGRRLGILSQRVDLVLAGGILAHSPPLLRDAIVNRVRVTIPTAHPVLPNLEPAAGALLLALDALHHGPKTAITHCVERSVLQFAGPRH